jgi:hypothetical protein
MCAAGKLSKTQQLKERWEEGELDCGSITPEFIKGLSPRELGMLGELIAIDYFNERGYALLVTRLSMLGGRGRPGAARRAR